MTRPDHPMDAIADLVSGRLEGAARSEVEAHLATCADCRGEFENALWMRQRLSDVAASPPTPEGLSGRIAAALNAEDAGDAGETEGAQANRARVSWLGAVFRRPVLAFGIPLLLLGAVFIGLRLQTPTLTQLVARDYREFKTDELNLEMLTPDGKLLEEFFVHRGIDFETRVLDLAMMQYKLEGGRVHRLAEWPSAAFAYTGPRGEYLLCQMYPGSIEDLPRGATLREHDCIKFYVYRKGDLTLAFWREGGVICVLVSDIAPEELVQLAFAKAMKVMPAGERAPHPGEQG